MDARTFAAVYQAQHERCDQILGRKAEEYAPDADKLVNFRKAAHLQGITMRQALVGMLAKHTVSVFDMMQSDQTFSMAQWEEKITDHLNYLYILRAILEEELRGTPNA